VLRYRVEYLEAPVGHPTILREKGS